MIKYIKKTPVRALQYDGSEESRREILRSISNDGLRTLINDLSIEIFGHKIVVALKSGNQCSIKKGDYFVIDDKDNCTVHNEAYFKQFFVIKS